MLLLKKYKTLIYRGKRSITPRTKRHENKYLDCLLNFHLAPASRGSPKRAFAAPSSATSHLRHAPQESNELVNIILTSIGWPERRSFAVGMTHHCCCVTPNLEGIVRAVVGK
ncbi:hypothetical protein E2C01_099898 [Portunus trituberculatus]|uniref:Uncharacterized protein n=1 Tax=Portunus trituberculatus TaxID=210409 RepID=A0A5B7K6P0_PORTR|nr:hypothetical protein [Portunus trituberculatus]